MVSSVAYFPVGWTVNSVIVFQNYAQAAMEKTRCSIRQAITLHERALTEAELRDKESGIQALEVSVIFKYRRC